MGRRLSRRDAVKALLAALVPGVAHGTQQERQDPDTVPARLPWPGVAGRPRERVTDYENDPFIIGVEKQLRCTCGCNLDVYVCRTTDFTCTTSPAMHQEAIDLVEEGKTAEEIIDEFVSRYGEVVLMAPRKEGFNIAGYVVPGITITLVGSGMVWLLARRTRRVAVAAAAATADAPGAVSEEETAKLEAELRNLEL